MGGDAAVGSVSMLKLLAALLFVVGLIFVSAWVFRRFNGARLPRRGAGRLAMRVAASLPLGERRYLTVVEVEERRFLLGVAPQSISMLAELPAPAPGAVSEPPAGEFAALLEKARRAFRREEP
jgi:flagellar protein FliO/FliZ